MEAYLNCFDGELRRNLEKIVAEMGGRQFSGYLDRLNEEITGIAVSDLKLTGEEAANLRVEFVYRIDPGWRKSGEPNPSLSNREFLS